MQQIRVRLRDVWFYPTVFLWRDAINIMIRIIRKDGAVFQRCDREESDHGCQGEGLERKEKREMPTRDVTEKSLIRGAKEKA